MSEEFFKYLNNLPDINKHKPYDRKKMAFVQKDVLNLTGGLFPARLIEVVQVTKKIPFKGDHKQVGNYSSWSKGEDWTQSWQNQLHPSTPKPELYRPPAELLSLGKQEYLDLAFDVSNWSYEETVYLFERMQTYNLNFIVVQDRYDFNGKTRVIEELKEHYYKISNRVLNSKGVNHPLAGYKYDPEYESTRKFQLQKYLLRNKDTNDVERKIIDEIKKLEATIKKQEKEQIDLKKALKEQEEGEGQGQQRVGQLLDDAEAKGVVPVYSRQQYLQKPLPLPSKLNLKMNDILQGLMIPERIIANQENEELYDELRRQTLLMLSAQRYVRKKEIEKRILEDKKKKQTFREEDPEKKKFPVPGQPTKKKINR